MTEGFRVVDRLFGEDELAAAETVPPRSVAARLAGWLGERLEEERDRLGLWVPVGLGLGVVFYFALPVEPADWAGAGVLLAVSLVGLLFRRRMGLALLCLAVGTIAAGFTAAQVRSALAHTPMLSRELGPVEVSGRVVGIDRLQDGTRVVLDEVVVARLPAARTPVLLRLKLAARHGRPLAGERIRLRAMLHPPGPPAEPGAFDFQRYAYFQGLGGVGYALSAPERIGEAAPGVLSAPASALATALEQAREAIAERVAEAVRSPGAAGVTTALLNGEMAGIPEPDMQAMRDSGLAHLLSISGLHIGLVAGIVFGALRALLALIEPVALRWPVKAISALAGLLAALAYTLLVGAPVPTFRSLLMTGLALVAIIVGREPFSMRLIAFAAAAVILIAPDALHGASFEMSFGAVAALIAAYEVLNPIVARWRSGAGMLLLAGLYLGGIALTSVVATAATTAFGLYHFQTLTFYSVVANMLAVPLTSFWVMPCGLLVYGLMPFGWEEPALVAMGWGVEGILEVARTVAAWPGATARVPAMPEWGLAAVTFGGLWLVVWRRRWRLLGLPLFLLGLVSPALTTRPDVLVSADGTQLAVRLADGRLAISNPRAERLTVDTWVRRDGARAPGPAWPKRGTLGGAPGEDGTLTCDPLGCRYRKADAVVTFSRDPQSLDEDCARSAAVITQAGARHCAAPVVIDAREFRRGGAQAITIEAGRVSVRSVGAWRGDRPWTVR